MDFQVKKLKVDISATPRKNSVTGPYNHPQGRQIRTLTEECTFC